MIFFDFVSQRDPTLLVLTLFLFGAMAAALFIDLMFTEDDKTNE